MTKTQIRVMFFTLRYVEGILVQSGDVEVNPGPKSGAPTKQLDQMLHVLTAINFCSITLEEGEAR